MKPAARRGGFEARGYQDEDEPQVLDLLKSALGGGPAGERTPEFFRWKHRNNPFGPSLMLVAEVDGRIVGLRAFMRWRFRAPDGAVRAVRAVDTATHPEYQGRGIFSGLTLRALEHLRGENDLVFNTPNEKSLAGYLKMGWKIVGKVPVSVRVRRPAAFAKALGSWRTPARLPRPWPGVEAETAAEALGDEEAVSALLADEGGSADRIRTARDPEFLRWRFGVVPGLDYRAVVERDGSGLSGLALFRVRPRGRLWESTVAEVIVRREDHRTARRLLRRVVAAAPVDHLTCHFPAGSAAARGATRCGFVRSPRGMTLVANPLRDGVRPEPLELRSWSLSLGDLEVF